MVLVDHENPLYLHLELDAGYVIFEKDDPGRAGSRLLSSLFESIRKAGDSAESLETMLLMEVGLGCFRDNQAEFAPGTFHLALRFRESDMDEDGVPHGSLGYGASWFARWLSRICCPPNKRPLP